MPLRLETATYTSPIGPLALVEDEAGPLVVEYPGRADRLQWRLELTGRTPEVVVEAGACAATTALLDAYFAGAPVRFPWPRRLLQWFDLSPSLVAVHRALCRIPFGATRSYDAIARKTGLHPRLVGQLTGANHLAILVPCHRVVGKDGALTGYSGGLGRKRWLLAHELRHRGLVMDAG